MQETMEYDRQLYAVIGSVSPIVMGLQRDAADEDRAAWVGVTRMTHAGPYTYRMVTSEDGTYDPAGVLPFAPGDTVELVLPGADAVPVSGAF